MTQDSQYVWYVGYGSNLNKQRFLCYILGGRPTYGRKVNRGSNDKTLPLDDRICRIPYRIYFALPNNINGTSSWGIGGVAFLRNLTSKDSSIGRKWKVTKAQYEEIWGQEGKSWYDKEILLGEEDGVPIYTITNSDDLSNILSLSLSCLKTMIEGLSEFSNMAREEIIDYLAALYGIKGKLHREDLLKI